MFKRKKEFEPFASKVWLSSPTMHGPELEYIKDAYETNWMSTVGEHILEAERMVCEKTGCGYAVGLSSGTAALHLAVRLAGVGPKDVVFCSDLTFAATVNPVLYEGGIPVFIDTEYDTWNMDPASLEQAFQLYPDTRAVVLAHLYGTPGKLEEIQKICKQHRAVLIEDAAESFGASYREVQTGHFGEISCLSGNGNKIITGSTGGFLLTDHKEIADKARKWSTQSREAAPWYQHEEVGYNYRMSNVVAGILRGQMQFLEAHIVRKKQIYERYQKGLADLPIVMNPYDPQNSRPNYWLSCLLIEEEGMCRQVRGEEESLYIPEHGKSCPMEILEALESIQAEGRPIWKPMHMQPMYRGSDFITQKGSGRATTDMYSKSKKEDRKIYLDVGMDIFQRGLCLPSDIKMSKEQQDRIIEVIRACFE